MRGNTILEIRPNRLGSYLVDYSKRKLPHRLGPMDSSGVPMFDPAQLRLPGRAPVYHPTVIIQYGLAHYENWLKTKDQASIDEIRTCARWLIANAKWQKAGQCMVWEYPFALRVPKVGPPFISGMGQGQGLSFLMRACEVGAVDNSDALPVMAAIAESFNHAVGDGGVITSLRSGNAFVQEIAHTPELMVLNGCLYGFFGLHEYLQQHSTEQLQRAKELIANGIDELLPQYDMGWWSRYSIGVRLSIAPTYYHGVHIQQLAHMGNILHNPLMLEYSQRWSDYTKNRYNRARRAITEFVHVNTNRTLTVLGANRWRYTRRWA